jgi:hypothetical protein
MDKTTEYLIADENKPIDGMSLSQYAAIKLKVPNSGTDWLDEMIAESLRNEIAARAMQGMLANSYRGGGSLPPLSEANEQEIALMAWSLADAMLEARKQQESP